MASAERELGAFMGAVSEVFGAEHARRAADDWLDEFERMDTLPETGSHFGVGHDRGGSPAGNLAQNRQAIRFTVGGVS
jgi:hypothetical protein